MSESEDMNGSISLSNNSEEELISSFVAGDKNSSFTIDLTYSVSHPATG